LITDRIFHDPMKVGLSLAAGLPVMFGAAVVSALAATRPYVLSLERMPEMI
jgi:hypothetical protein